MEKSNEHILLEQAYEELRIQLEEANDIIHAIRSGEVDALIVNGKDGHQVFTLKSADHTYRIFIEQMTESALTLDTSGQILYCNSRFAELLELPLERVMGLSFLDFIPRSSRLFAKQVIDGAWETDTKAELDLQNRSGDAISVQLSLKALNLDEGTALSIIITDLTELKKNQTLLETRNRELEESRKIAEELNENLENTVRLRTLELESRNEELAVANSFQAEVNNQLSIALTNLRESEDNLHSAFNAGDLGSCSLDLKTGKAEMSERFRQLYGLPLYEEITWDMVLAAVEDEYIDGLNQIMKDCMVFGKPVDSTYPIKHLISGERRWMRVVGKVKKDADGSFSSVYAVLMDVTVQKQDEQRKNDFIAMVSHELKTPLTSMKGYIQVLRKTKKDVSELTQKVLERAEHQVTKMTNMINGFLNIARLESGKITIERKPIRMSVLMDDVIEEFTTTVTSHHIKFSCNGDFSVDVDREKLSHVINNLISNAVKYSPLDSNIYVDCYTEDSNAIFKVKDEGMGITSYDLPNLFERFYRVENAQMTSISGFGIGLYLSAEIITRHGGKIWAESEFGKGSVFYFSIPLSSALPEAKS
ncbi:ATP-binding protein [Pedobacter frigoris]|uniref:sensor histidine kinase n=1 Tax=Pedobacter frigoris TaxID=2571272 RepID=UPI00292D9DC5|nr:ATP-binding protein [Pedobacter frigoris]